MGFQEIQNVGICDLCKQFGFPGFKAVTFLFLWQFADWAKRQSEVGFEPTPSFEDQNTHSYECKIILSLAP